MFLVTNIPEVFRTPDLRNFFSDLVEQEAFNCFHFRNRPHDNFIKLLRNCSEKKLDQNDSIDGSDGVKKSDSSVADCEYCKLNYRANPPVDGRTVSGANNKGGILEKSSQIEMQKEKSFELQVCGNEDIRTSNISVCVCQRSRSRLCESPIPDESKRSDSSQSKNKKESHWLSSGLSGLTSLINEKKQKAFKEIPVLNNGSTADSNKPLYKDMPYLARNNLDIVNPVKQRPIGIYPLKLSDNELLASANGKCCIVNIKEGFAEKFQYSYHKKHWVDRQGDVLHQQCFIVNLGLDDFGDFSGKEDVSFTAEDYLTRGEKEQQRHSLMDMKNLIEFCPPTVMPQGNVGTATLYFKNLIRTCQLPGTIITKLGLQFPRSRGKKRFGQVPYDYGTRVHPGNLDTHDRLVAFTATGHLIPASFDFTQKVKKPKKKLKTLQPKLELEVEAEDGAEVEEWERYEAFHNDVTSQDRTKERLYEKEIELVWEKGGPGLVFYTDAQYWRDQEGDFDEQTADEWDVDMSVYYEKGTGDRDALDSVRMLQSNELRSCALTQSAFHVGNKHSRKEADKKKEINSEKRRKIGPRAPPKIGGFEAHTRGFGRRLLESQGWKDGQGLGRQSDGLPYALGNDGQHPLDKKGFGYYGEKFQGWGKSTSSSREHRQGSSSEQDSDGGIRISTVFDVPRDIDPPTHHLRTSEPTRLSPKVIVNC